MPPKKPKSNGVVVPHVPKWYQRLAAGLVFVLERLLTITLRWELRDVRGAGTPLLLVHAAGQHHLHARGPRHRRARRRRRRTVRHAAAPTA